MEKLISKRTLINQLMQMVSDYSTKTNAEVTIPAEDVISLIETQESVQYQENILLHGKWVVKSDKDGFAKWDECSICGHKLSAINEGREMRYCPGCGSRMDSDMDEDLSEAIHIQVNDMIHHIENMISNKIMLLPEESFEPTDTEGHAYEAIVYYKDREFGVYLSAMNRRSYEQQAAICIYKQLWYATWGGNVYLSYSGGLDSTVLLHMIRKYIGKAVPAVFSNTGLEFPEIVRFARKASGEFVEIYPMDKKGHRISYREVILKHGYPLVSKDTAARVRKLRHGNIKTQERFEKYLDGHRDQLGNKPAIRLFWHGSRNPNWFSILQKGLLLNPDAVITGKMFGQGVYFAPSALKSWGYTSGKGACWTKGDSDTAFMALYATAYGKPYVVFDHNDNWNGYSYKRLQSEHNGCNCVHAKADRGMLRNDEVIFYCEDQMTIRYICEFTA